MIKASTARKWLPLYEALASEVRLHMIELLAERPRNIKELAEATGLSSAITTMHVRKLEQAELVRAEIVRKDRGTHKICYLAESAIEIILPHHQQASPHVHEIAIPVGHYTHYDIRPTCGLATPEKIIGQFDDPRYFSEPERMNAGILWLGQGYVEYRVPNYLLPGQLATALEVVLEISSEAPGVNENWPSDITFSLNGIEIGTWTSPGDFGCTRGKFTPSWWNPQTNQFGLLKVIRIEREGAFIDGTKLSDIGLDAVGLHRNQWTFRLEVKEDARHIGGLTLFGRGFGNYDQDILFRLFWEESK